MLTIKDNTKVSFLTFADLQHSESFVLTGSFQRTPAYYLKMENPLGGRNAIEIDPGSEGGSPMRVRSVTIAEGDRVTRVNIEVIISF